jgi:hypothetical protein
MVILGNFILKIYPESSSAQVSESFCGIVIPTTEVSLFSLKKLSGKDVSFVDMTARGDCFTPYSKIVELPFCHPELFSYAE